MGTQHSEKICVCDECGNTCNSKYDLTVHLEDHYKNRAFPCGHCTKGFHARRDLERHEVIHKSGRPFTCLYCEKGFSFTSSLKKHTRSQHQGSTEKTDRNIVKKIRTEESILEDLVRECELAMGPHV